MGMSPIPKLCITEILFQSGSSIYGVTLTELGVAGTMKEFYDVCRHFDRMIVLVSLLCVRFK